MKHNKLTLLILSILLASSAFANDKPCRSAVVDAYTSLGEKIAADDFSNREFSELGISYAEFNAMDSRDQEAIYMKVKPIEVMVEETIQKLTRYINRYVGTFYEFYMIDELEQWRSSRDTLRSCKY